MWCVQAGSGLGPEGQGDPGPAGACGLIQLFCLPLRPSQNGRRARRDSGTALRGLPWASPGPPLTGRAFSLLPTGALQIESSEETDQGKYECVATNSAGVRYSSPANLYVRGRERRVQVEAGTRPPRPRLPSGSQPPGSPVPCRPKQEAPCPVEAGLGPGSVSFRTSVSLPVNGGSLTLPHPCAL